MDEKPYKYENLPIPSYEEATSSRPASSQSRTGPEEVSDDAERQGLLYQHNSDGDNASSPSSRRNNYEPPTVESERNSLDSLDGLEVESDAEVRREMQEMDVEDPDSDNGSHRSLLTYRFKRFTSFTSSFSSRLPSFGRYMPSIRLPRVDWQAVDANRIVILGRLFGVIIIIGIVYVLIASDILSMGRNRAGAGHMYDPESVRAFVQGGFQDRLPIERHLQHITEFPHLAGSEGSYVLGEWISELFKEYEIEDVSMERFEVYLNYPRQDGRRVAIVEPQAQQWEARLEEENEETFVFHGHSRSGDVTGPLIYANYGSRQDFEVLQNKKISVKGAIVLVRTHGTQSDLGSIVKTAEDAGALGCIIFNDPQSDRSDQQSEIQDGRLMPLNGVQRGSVSLLSRVIGDVLSPGWAATPGNNKRLTYETTDGLVNIPSTPISRQDASHLLEALHNHGEQVTGNWAGAPDTEYWTGDQNSPKVNLRNSLDEETRQPIYNVIGRINGWEQPQKKIVVGNHRDAWCLGAADPGSGTAVLLAVARVFGALLHLGWRPLRTIEFISWDAGEYNLAGSTEHVENRIDELRRSGVAYLNVDSATTGVEFHASASPLYTESLHRAISRVMDPYSNKTIRETWEAGGISTTPIGAGGDYTPFQHIAGTSSIDLSFTGQDYPKGSCYDNLDWMLKFGDPGGQVDFSAALGEIWSLLILELADAPLLPFDVEAYTKELVRYVDDLDSDLQNIATATSDPAAKLDLESMRSALSLLDTQMRSVQIFDQRWHSAVYGSGGFESSTMTVKRIDRNNRVGRLEASLLDLGVTDSGNGAPDKQRGDQGGLPGRSQYKHVVTGPQLDDSTQVVVFPGIRHWVDLKDWSKAQEEVQKVAGILERAAQSLGI